MLKQNKIFWVKYDFISVNQDCGNVLDKRMLPIVVRVDLAEKIVKTLCCLHKVLMQTTDEGFSDSMRRAA